MAEDGSLVVVGIGIEISDDDRFVDCIETVIAGLDSQSLVALALVRFGKLLQSIGLVAVQIRGRTTKAA